jgi:hypothetical protein
MQNDIRYDISMKNFKQKEYIIYQVTVLDLAIGMKY